jgi:hypothetical protein
MSRRGSDESGRRSRCNYLCLSLLLLETLLLPPERMQTDEG